MGLIAQEVQEIVPEAVTYDEYSDRYGVNYSNMVALLIESVKDQNKIINSQQKQIDELKIMCENMIAKNKK